MVGIQQFHQGTRIPKNLLTPNLVPQRFGGKNVAVMDDVKGVIGHMVMGVGLAAFAGYQLYDKVPGIVWLTGLVITSTAITFLPVIPAVCAIGGALSSISLPALPAAGFTATNILGTMPMFIGGGYLFQKIAGAPPSSVQSLSQELPERRLLRRLANLGLHNFVCGHYAAGALGYNTYHGLDTLTGGCRRIFNMIL